MLSLARRPVVGLAARIAALTVLPVALGFWFLHLDLRNIDIPFDYGGLDQIWQLTLTKGLLDNGWVLNNPYMGAPDVAHWYNNAAAQTSALHSVIMWCIGQVMPDAVATQQAYFLLNFSLIAISAYVACRLLLVERFVAVCVGLLYCFLQTRFNSFGYAFIENYFMIPLSVVPSVWMLMGKFAVSSARCSPPDVLHVGLGRVLSSPYFTSSVAIMALSAITDGYYAFFALLLLSFAAVVRLIGFDARAPRSMVAPGLLILTLISSAFALQVPLMQYRWKHESEFSNGGVPDPAINHRPAEAEIYSTALKVLIAPLGNNRIPALGRLGMRMVGTYNEARSVPQGQFASLCSLGSLLLIGLLGFISVVLARGGTMVLPVSVGPIAALSLFVFLGSIAGGVGTLVAMVYPAIRAYERFPLFLSFLLYCGAGIIATHLLARLPQERTRAVWRAAIGLVAAAGVLDQVPSPIPIQRDAVRYRAERAFVRRVEASLPDGAEVYQFPYSQYMSLNPYYGWGAFAHMRLYLHSRHLRWSNGASKNSPVDAWHTRLSQLPVGQIVTEMEAAGFRGFLVDRTVVSDPEYAAIAATLVDRTGQAPLEDAVSHLAFWRLPDPGYRVEFGPDYKVARAVVVTNPTLLAPEPVSRFVDKGALLSAAGAAGNMPAMIARTDHPALFTDVALLDGGLGLIPIAPISAMREDTSCPEAEGHLLSIGHDALTLQLTNRSGFAWHLNSGLSPIRVGMRELRYPSGGRIRWDGGFRVPGAVWVPASATVRLPVPLATADITTGVPSGVAEVAAVFALVQDGVAWFPGGECHVRLTR